MTINAYAFWYYTTHRLEPFVKDEYRMCDAKQLKQKIKNKEKYKYMVKILKIDNPAIEPSKLDLKCLANVYTTQEYGMFDLWYPQLWCSSLV